MITTPLFFFVVPLALAVAVGLLRGLPTGPPIRRTPTRRVVIPLPCPRVEDDKGGIRWMHGSGDIIEYLEGRFVVE